MKTKTIIKRAMMILVLVFWSCDNSYDEIADDLINSERGNSQVISVSPNGIDDTQNIKDAFTDAKLLGDGTTVQLTSGTFFISEPIIIKDFDGTFKGSGKNNTVLEDVPNSIFPLVSSGPLLGQRGFLIFHLENKMVSNLEISNMTIQLKGMVEESAWHQSQIVVNSNIGITVFGKVNGIEDFDSSEINVTVDGVDFIGEESEAYLPNGFNHDIGLLISGEWLLEHTPQTILFKTVQPISGSINVTNCLFRNNRFALDIPGTNGTDILIGGSPKDKNIFENVLGAITFFDMSGVDVEISYNKGKNIDWWGIYAEQGYDAYLTTDGFGPYLPELGIPEPASIQIKHNYLELDQWCDGIIISDVANAFGDGPTLNTTITKNDFNMSNTSPYYGGGIYGWNVDNAIISNNKFHGEAAAGIYFGLWEGLGDNNWLMLGNNLSKLNAGIAPIFLGPGSNNCTVIGGPNATNVLDLGTNNSITGVNNYSKTQEPQLMETMKNKRALKRSFRN